MALRRKRSLSVADLPVPKEHATGSASGNDMTNGGSGTSGANPASVASGGVKKKGSRMFGSGRPEESGYDSDATRKSSPRGSLKNALTGSSTSSGGGGIGSSSCGDSGSAGGGEDSSSGGRASEEGSSSG